MAGDEKTLTGAAQPRPTSTPHHLLVLTAREELAADVGRAEDHTAVGWSRWAESAGAHVCTRDTANKLFMCTIIMPGHILILLLVERYGG